MEKRDSIVFARIQKSNDFEINECHALEVQRWATAPHQPASLVHRHAQIAADR
jgi:hypothetical protein